MANSIPQPGVEVVQEIRTPTPTVFAPTLPACICGPAYEVIELYVNGALNRTKALYEDADGESYNNFRAMELMQTEFPGGHVTPATQGLTNVKAGLVNVLEDETSAYVKYGSADPKELAELNEADNTRVMKGFLIAHNVATRPYIQGSVDLSSASLNLNGKELFISVDTNEGLYPDYVPEDSHNSYDDGKVEFTTGSVMPGGLYNADDIVAEINKVHPGLASLRTVNSAKYLVLSSTKYGASARICLRYGTANTLVGFQSASDGLAYSLGGGFRAKDDGDGDFTSPFIELYPGAERHPTGMEAGAICEDGSFDSSAHPLSNINFTRATGSNLHIGDSMYADGGLIADLYAAQNRLLTLGQHLDGTPYPSRKVEVNTPLAATPWAPRYVYFVARNLAATAPGASTKAQALSANSGSDPWSDPEPAMVKSAEDITNFDFGAVGKSLQYTVVKNGVVSEERTHTLVGDSASIAELVAGLNTGSGNGGSFQVIPSLSDYDELVASNDGDKLILKTGTVSADLTGSDQQLTLGNGDAWAQVDPASTPNMVESEIYQGLDTYTTDWRRGDGTLPGIKWGAQEATAAAYNPSDPVRNGEKFNLQVVENNGKMIEYVLKLMGDFKDAGPIKFTDDMKVCDNLAKELNGQSQPSSGQVLIETIDGDDALKDQRFVSNPGQVRWHFQGSSEYLPLTSASAAGLVVGDQVYQGSVGSETFIGTIVKLVGSATDVSVDSGELKSDEDLLKVGGAPTDKLTQPHSHRRFLAVNCRQEGSSNYVKIVENVANVLTETIGFTDGATVRGIKVRPGSFFYFHIDQNPEPLKAVPQERHIQYSNLDGLDVIFLDDIAAEMNDEAKQNIATVDTSVPGQAKLKLVSTKYGLPSEVKIDPRDQEGNAGYVEIMDSQAGLTIAELGQEFDRDTAITETAGGLATHTGKGILSVGTGRPLPDFAVMAIDPAQVWVGSQVLRNNSTGEPLGDADAELFFTYRGLRQDIAAEQKANGFELLRFNSLNELEEQLGPVNDKNPLALGVRTAIANVTSIPINAIGVGDINADEPDGTLSSWTKLLEYLESQRVYILAPMTEDRRVHDLFKAHVLSMSEPTSKSERICYLTSKWPTRKVDALIGSGLDANSMPQLNSLLLEESIIAGAQVAGINDISSISAAEGMFLELEGTAKRWNIQSINPAGAGSYIVLRTAFAAGENDDNFYTTTDLPSGLVNYDWSVSKKGLPLDTQEDVAEALAAQGEYFAHRRIRHVVLKEAAQNFSGTEDIVSAVYMCAAYAALAAQRNPQQGFTNLPVSGFTKVYGTNDSFSEALLDAIAGGGNFIIIQPNAGGNVFCRHQLTTDVSSVETRECSIGRVLDFSSYTMRDGTKQMIGTFNITPTFLDQLSTIIQGLLEFLRESGVVLSATLNNLVQDVDDPTSLLVEITLEVPFPANYIKITLVI